jgi:hypothetical protein
MTWCDDKVWPTVGVNSVALFTASQVISFKSRSRIFLFGSLPRTSAGLMRSLAEVVMNEFSFPTLWYLEFRRRARVAMDLLNGVESRNLASCSQ